MWRKSTAVRIYRIVVLAMPLLMSLLEAVVQLVKTDPKRRIYETSMDIMILWLRSLEGIDQWSHAWLTGQVGLGSASMLAGLNLAIFWWCGCINIQCYITTILILSYFCLINREEPQSRSWDSHTVLLDRSLVCRLLDIRTEYLTHVNRIAPPRSLGGRLW